MFQQPYEAFFVINLWLHLCLWDSKTMIILYLKSQEAEGFLNKGVKKPFFFSYKLPLKRVLSLLKIRHKGICYIIFCKYKKLNMNR